MKLLAYWASSFMPMFIIHMVELPIFISLIWLIDRFTALPIRLRCTLWSLALIQSLDTAGVFHSGRTGC